MDSVANHFPATNALDWRILHIQSQNILRLVITPDLHRNVPRCLDPDFTLGSPAFPLFLFYETATGGVVIHGEGGARAYKWDLKPPA